MYYIIAMKLAMHTKLSNLIVSNPKELCFDIKITQYSLIYIIITIQENINCWLSGCLYEHSAKDKCKYSQSNESISLISNEYLIYCIQGTMNDAITLGGPNNPTE